MAKDKEQRTSLKGRELMSMYHYREYFFTKTKTGESAWDSASYRSGEKLYDRDNAKHVLRKDNVDIVAYSNIYLPDGCPERLRDRQTLWDEIMVAEKNKNAQWGHEYELSFSNELSFEQCKEITERFIAEQLTKKGMICDANIHWKEGNHHVHITTPTRPFDLEKDAFGAKSKKVDGKKISLVSDWYDRESLKERRKMWADLQNEYLSQEHQVSEKSYKDQGIEKKPRRFLSRGDYEALKDITNGKDISDRHLSHPETLISILEDRRKVLDTELIKDVMTIERRNHMVQEQNKSIEKTEYPFGCDLDKIKITYLPLTEKQLETKEWVEAFIKSEFVYNYLKETKNNEKDYLAVDMARYAKEQYGIELQLVEEKTGQYLDNGEYMKYLDPNEVNSYNVNKVHILNINELEEAINNRYRELDIDMKDVIKIVDEPKFRTEKEDFITFSERAFGTPEEYKEHIKTLKAVKEIDKDLKDKGINKFPDLLKKYEHGIDNYRQSVQKAISEMNFKTLDQVGNETTTSRDSGDQIAVDSMNKFEKMCAVAVTVALKILLPLLKEVQKELDTRLRALKAEITSAIEKPIKVEEPVKAPVPKLSPSEKILSEKLDPNLSLDERIERAKLQAELGKLKNMGMLDEFDSRVKGHIPTIKTKDLLKLAEDLGKMGGKVPAAIERSDDLER